MPVRTTIADDRFGPAAEGAAYYAVLELFAALRAFFRQDPTTYHPEPLPAADPPRDDPPPRRRTTRRGAP